MRRYAQLVGIKPEAIEEYIRIHAEVWPGVLATIHACNIRNYSIFLHEQTLFAYFEYIGDDYEADMARMAADPVTQQWWTMTNPMQVPLPDRPEGSWWMPIPEVFHTD
jgi:L-rhamnose mutarotase